MRRVLTFITVVATIAAAQPIYAQSALGYVTNAGIPQKVTPSTPLPVGSADSAATAPLAAATINSTYALAIGGGYNTATFALAGLAASGATLTLEGTNDGTTWTTAYSPAGSTGLPASTFTADGGLSVNVAGRRGIRLRVSTAGTGSITVASNLSVAVREVRLDAAPPPGGTLGFVADAAWNLTDAAASVVSVLKALTLKLASAIGLVGSTAPTSAMLVGGVGPAGNLRGLATDTSGSLDVMRTSTRVITKTSLAANTSTSICPATANVTAQQVQFQAGAVGIGLSAEALTQATMGTAAGTPDFVVPAGANSSYVAPVPPTNAYTGYSATAQFVTCIQDVRL